MEKTISLLLGLREKYKEEQKRALEDIRRYTNDQPLYHYHYGEYIATIHAIDKVEDLIRSLRHSEEKR